jgi:hypothetical protein
VRWGQRAMPGLIPLNAMTLSRKLSATPWPLSAMALNVDLSRPLCANSGHCDVVPAVLARPRVREPIASCL